MAEIIFVLGEHWLQPFAFKLGVLRRFVECALIKHCQFFSVQVCEAVF